MHALVDTTTDLKVQLLNVWLFCFKNLRSQTLCCISQSGADQFFYSKSLLIAIGTYIYTHKYANTMFTHIHMLSLTHIHSHTHTLTYTHMHSHVLKHMYTDS